MPVSADDLAFGADNHAAAMITVGSDGRPKVARVGVAMVDDSLWSSSTEGRTRTNRLRADPRCTLYVRDSGFSWVALELEQDAFLQTMREEQTLDLRVRDHQDLRPALNAHAG